MAAESDENLAKKLQAQFDAENAVYQHQVLTDARIAATMSRAHDMSDSDSDATIEPPGYSESLDGSRDLFDTTSGSSFMSKTSSSSLDRSRQKSSSPLTPPKRNTLTKRISRTHEISDSEDDSDNNKVSKPSPGQGNKGRPNGAPSPHRSSLKNKNSSLAPRVSKMHDMSDSGNDSEDDAKASKSASESGQKLKMRQAVNSSPSSSHRQSPQAKQALHTRPTSSDKSKSLSRNTESVSDLRKSNSDLRMASGEGESMRQRKGGKPICQYGDRCYRTNPAHFQDFDHEGEKNGKRKTSQPVDKDADTGKKKARLDDGAGPSSRREHHTHGGGSGSFVKTVADVVEDFQPLSFFLTKVSGIDDKFNSTGAVSLKDILSPLMGNLEASCQFNFMFDIPWVVSQYPKAFRTKPLLLVHGEQGRSETELKAEGASYPHISFCRAKLEIMYGTHHTKMMLLLYDCGMRVVILTANLVSGDWHQKTQGVWISPLFPKLSDKGGATATGATAGPVKGDSPTGFKSDLLAYLAAYRCVPLTPWEKHIQQHDMSSACVYIIASVPGRHTGAHKSSWGHLKLRKVLQDSGPAKQYAGQWPVYGQFSSIGSLGPTPEQWLCDEWLTSLSQSQASAASPLPQSKLQLVYPSKENVRLCLEGYAGGGCLPYSIKTARKQIYLNNFVRKWGSAGRGRTEAIPHIKTYARVSPDFSQLAWFLVTSANLSKAAWGALEKQKTQLMIRSYEIGVLFLPKHFGVSGGFPVAKTAEEVAESKEIVLPFPYDLPPPTYQKGDRIWMWDVPCVDLPDTHGKQYCPTL